MKEKNGKAPYPYPQNAPSIEAFILEEEMKGNSNRRTYLVSLIGIVISSALVYLGVIWRNNNTMAKFFPDNGEVPGIIAEILIAIGGALFTLFAISLIWELYVRRSWLREMRLYLFKTLCSPHASLYSDTTDWQYEVLRQIMTNLSEKRVSDLLYKRFRDGAFSTQKARKNINYEVTLSEIQDVENKSIADNFFRAHLKFKFQATITKSEFPRKVRLICKNDSCGSTDSYYQSLEDYDDDIYRYILLTDKENFFESISALEVTSCRITYKRKTISLNIAKSADDANVTIVSVPDSAKKDFDEFVDQECEISFEIDTYADKQYSFYAMMFGY